MVRLRFVCCALLCGLALTACVAMPPPTIFQSPLPQPRRAKHLTFLPLIVWNGNNNYGRGLAATYSTIDGCADAQAIGARWLYDWGPLPPLCTGVLSLPMVWSRDLETCPAIGPGNPVLLWNEPANSAQWGGQPISPEEAIPLTYHLTEVCYPDRTFATPAQYNGYVGLAWLTAWWDGYIAMYHTPPRVVVMALHCYGGTSEACEIFVREGLAWAQARNLTVLLTEWGVPPPYAGGELPALAEADRLYHWLIRQPGLVGEAFFAARIRGDEWWSFPPPVTSLLEPATGMPTAWGRWYQAH